MARPSTSGRDAAPSSRSLAYRPDIDGLRAFSILAVILYHFFPERMPGGFTGVDVFFVISGYLISGILLRNLDTGSFRYLNFYRRRIQRIFPALIVVLAASLVAGWFLLFDNEWRPLTAHVIVGAGFASNLELLREIRGYFNSPDKPLLNLWSLGIEEQFYILWPLFLALAWKRRSRVLPWLLLVLAGSFALEVGLVHKHPNGAFYFPAMRFWELALGAILAYVSQFRPNAARHLERAAALLSLGGFLLLGAALACVDDNRSFPGWWALLPTWGAALTIAAGPKAWFNRLVLSSPPVVFLGLISYPLYLWHWPLLVFVKLVEPYRYANLAYEVATILAAVLLACLTYWLVEQPLRHHRSLVVPWALSLSMAALGIIGLAFYFGIHSRLFRQDVQSFLTSADDWSYPEQFSNLRRDQFRVGKLGTGPNKILFIGDSHAEQYFDRVDFLLSGALGQTDSAVFATRDACPPLPGIRRVIYGRPCNPFFDFAMRQTDDPQVHTVVFAAYWEAYFGYSRAGRMAVQRLGDFSPFPKSGIELADYAFSQFGRTIQSLRARGMRVFVILSNPTSPRYDPRAMISRFTGRIAPQDVTRGEAEVMRPIIERLAQTAAASGAITIDPLPYFCDESVCKTTDDRGQPIYVDTSHLRGSWVKEHATFIDQIFE